MPQPETKQGNERVRPQAGENYETAVGNLKERRKMGVHVWWENEFPCQHHFWITRLLLPSILPSERAEIALAGTRTALWRAQPPMNDAACLMEYTCPSWASGLHTALIFTIVASAEKPLYSDLKTACAL